MKKKTVLLVAIVLILSLTFGLLMSVSACASPAKEKAQANDATEEATEETSASQRTLNLFVWEGYTEPEWVEPFEKENNCKVNVTYLSTEDEQYSKLKAGVDNPTYDLTTTSIANAKSLFENNITTAVDESKIPEYANSFDFFKGDLTRLDGKLFGIPFDWGTMPLEVNLDVVEEPYDTWGVLWDEKYKGSLSMLDDPVHSIATAAIYLGMKDPYNLNDEEFQQVKEALLKNKPLMRTYTHGFGEASDLFVSGEVVATFSLGEYLHKLLKEQGLNVKQVVPREGAVFWSDLYCVVNNSPNQDLAHKWINHILKLENQKIFVEKTGYGGVNKGLPEVLSEDLKELLNMQSEQAIIEYFSKLIPMGQPESYEKRIEIWNEVKAGV